MAVTQTNAARAMASEGEKMTSHRVISLLMQGALERVAQARCALVDGGDEEEQVILISKIIAIINGLRGSLNIDEGGEIAVNLNNLYEYILARLNDTDSGVDTVVLEEVGSLINEVKTGWDAIEQA